MTSNTPQTIRIIREPVPEKGLPADVTVEHKVTYWHHTGFLITGPYSEKGMNMARKFPEGNVGWWEKKTQSTTTVKERIS